MGAPTRHTEAGGKPVPLTRTTTFIDCIEDKAALSDWRSRMTLLGAAARPALLDAARQLDPAAPADKRRLNALAQQAQDIAGASVKRERGTHLHTLSERVDRGEPLPLDTPDSDLSDMAAYLTKTSVFEVKAVEKFVVVPELGTAGTSTGPLHTQGRARTASTSRACSSATSRPAAWSTGS